MVDLKKLAHAEVRRAIEALQSGDKAAWLACFSENAAMSDDGSLRLIGHFHSDQWGEFKTYFRFHVGADGRFDRLDVGQAE